MISLIFISIILNIIFLLIIFFNNLSKNDCRKRYAYKYIVYNNLKSYIKSGDLLLFSAFEFDPITRIFGHRGFSHVGLIIKYQDILYSLEMIGSEILYPFTPKKIGLIMHPLEDRIKHYQGYIFHASLLQPLNNDQEYQLFNYSKKPYKMPTLTFLNLFNIKKNLNPNSNTKFCSQFVVNILEDLNIIDRQDSYKFWNYNRKLVNLCNDDIYSYPIQIISNELLITNNDKRNPIFLN